ncbi:hypothetical protein [Oscillibacter sp. MSJ-31]|uniref:PBECR3 domain-containing polyvalent protein n=1 Tax=Oscillibacter sp. MSJ-31 TaxID=2841526 RepID=UPI001C10BF2C|nr:hypothetical protein [Oscillibacter sp. MSJ-31]MBU5456519.1 hypothetical protein [Oscillibacter sp. MSJ-31]
MAEMPDLVAYQKRVEAKKEKAKDEKIEMPDLVAYQKRQEEKKTKGRFIKLEENTVAVGKNGSRLVRISDPVEQPKPYSTGEAGAQSSPAAASPAATASYTDILVQEARKYGASRARSERSSHRTANHADAERRAQAKVVSDTIRDKKGGMLGGTVRGWLAGQVGAAASGLEALQAADWAVSPEKVSIDASRRNIENYTAKRDAAQTAEERARWQQLIDRNERLIAINSEAYAKKTADVENAVGKLGDTRAKLKSDAEYGIAKEKEGLGAIGRTAVDVGVAGGQMAMDALAGGLPSIATRVFGDSTQEAKEAISPDATTTERMEGKTKALTYGAGSAAVSVATEKLANIAAPFKKVFGGGVLDKALEGAVAKMGGSAAGKAALSFLSEGGEEMLEDVVQPILQSIYNGKGVRQNYSELELQDALYDGLIGGILGLAGSGAEIAGNAITRGESAKLSPQEGAEATRANGEGNLTPDAQNAAEGAQSAEKTAPKEGTAKPNYNILEADAIRREGKTFRNLVAGFDTSVSAFFDKWSGGRKNGQGEKLEKLYLGMLTDAQRKAVSDILGYPVSERNVIVTNDDVRHILREHGSPEAELRKGNLPLERWAIDALPEVVTQPDSITPGEVQVGGKNDGKRGVLLSKSMPDGKVITVQFDNKGRGTMEITTMYVKENSGDFTQTLNVEEASPQLTAEPVSGPVSPAIENSISSNGENVKRGTIEPRTLYIKKKGTPTSTVNAANTANTYTSETFEPEVPNDSVAQGRGTVNTQDMRSAREYAPGRHIDPLMAAIFRGREVQTDAQTQKAPDILEREIQRIYGKQKAEDLPNSMGAAAAGFETPDSQSAERMSNLANGQMEYTEQRGEASGKSREDYYNAFRYRTQTEAQSLQQAENLLYVERNGARKFLKDVDEAAYNDIASYLEKAPAWNGVMVDAASMIEQELLRRSIDLDVSDDAYNHWAEVMREHATETGRGTQAWSKWTARNNNNGQTSEPAAWENLQKGNLSAEERAARMRQIIGFDKRIESATSDVDMKQIILDIADERGTLKGMTGKQSKLLRSIAEKSLDTLTHEQLKQFAYNSSAALSTDAIAPDIGKKLKTMQVLNMLSNPKTAAKNLVGNTTFYAIDATTMRGAALLDMALSKITGTRSVAAEQFALSKSSRESIAKAIRLSLAEITMDVDMGGDSRYQQHGGKRTFKADGAGVLNTGTVADKFVERLLSSLERNQAYLLTTSDEAYKGAARATQAATQSLIDKGKIKNATNGYAKEQADRLAAYRTFQDNERFAASTQAIHDILNLVGIGDSGKRISAGDKSFTVRSFGAGDLTAPFTRVAGNLASVSIDYSPVNTIKGTVEILNEIYKAALHKDADPTAQARAVSDFARGMTGTAIAYGIMQLVKAGAIKRAADEEDKDVALANKNEGMSGTQINIDALHRLQNGESAEWQNGDTLLDLSSIEPLNFLVDLGVEMADNGTTSLLSVYAAPETYSDTFTSVARTVGKLPGIENTKDFFGDVLVYKNDPKTAAIEALGKTAVSSATPNVVAALAKGLDEKQRNIYTGGRTRDVLLDDIRSRFPVARETLPTTVNTFGEEKKYQGSTPRRVFDAMLNPINMSEFEQSDISREMNRVYRETGTVDFFPTTRKPDSLSYTDKDKKEHIVSLDYDQQQQFQKDCAALQMASTADMIASQGYKRANAEEQAVLLTRCYTYAYESAKSEILGEDAVDAWVGHAKNARSELGMSTTDYLYYYEKYGSSVMSGLGFEKTQRMLKAGFSVEDRVDMKNNIDADKNDSVSQSEARKYLDSRGYTRAQKADLWTIINKSWKKNPYD